MPNPDIYIPLDTDRIHRLQHRSRIAGTLITLKAATGTKIAPSFYFPFAIGGVTGASEYEWNIGYCNTTMMGFGDLLLAEPGNMVGPTSQGMDTLIARDPSAYWDTAENKVVSSMHPSPRVVAIPLFDPVYYDSGKQNGRNADLKVVNYMGFFIEEMQGNNVIGRITPIGGILTGQRRSGAGRRVSHSNRSCQVTAEPNGTTDGLSLQH